jgi:hypothetical protein
MIKMISGMLAVSLVVCATNAAAQAATAPRMTFFITSVGAGDGGNLGGLAGADAHCQSLAAMVNGGDLTWRAYLSTAAAGATPPVNARDRIGSGPWYNSRGALIAATVEDLHGDVERDRSQINQQTALNEKGTEVNGRTSTPNQHDILTGSDSHGRAIPFLPASATTCNNWTSNAAGSAVLGHHDRSGGGNSSWNAAHGSRSCSQPDLVATGGAGLFYCFALNAT